MTYEFTIWFCPHTHTMPSNIVISTVNYAFISSMVMAIRSFWQHGSLLMWRNDWKHWSRHEKKKFHKSMALRKCFFCHYNGYMFEQSQDGFKCSDRLKCEIIAMCVVAVRHNPTKTHTHTHSCANIEAAAFSLIPFRHYLYFSVSLIFI